MFDIERRHRAQTKRSRDGHAGEVPMKLEEALQKVLEYAGHRFRCDALGVNWNKGPCDCGWEQLEEALKNRRREAVMATRLKNAG